VRGGVLSVHRAWDGSCRAGEETAAGETTAGRDATQGEVHSTETVDDESAGEGRLCCTSNTHTHIVRTHDSLKYLLCPRLLQPNSCVSILPIVALSLSLRLSYWVELSRDICNWCWTHKSRKSAGRRYIRDTATTSTLVLEEVGLELALEWR